MEIVDSNKSLIEPYEVMVDKAFLNLRSDLTNPDMISRQANDEVEKEWVTDVSDTLDKDRTDESVLKEESSLTPAYTTLILLPDSELNSLIRSLNLKQRELFSIDQCWTKQYVKSKAGSKSIIVEPSRAFLADNACCGKSF